MILPEIIVFQFFLIYDNPQSLYLFVRNVSNFLHHEVCLLLQRLHMTVKSVIVGSETPRILLFDDSKEVVCTETLITVECFPYFHRLINFQSQSFNNLAQS